MRHRILSASFPLLLATACGAPLPEDGVELGSVAQPIVNGVVDADTANDSAVYVFSRWESEAVTCTGTLIAPNLIATALHCVTKTPTGACTETSRDCFTCGVDGSLSSTNGLGLIGPEIEPENIAITVGSTIYRVAPSAYAKDVIGSGSTQICRGDIAFVVLDRDLDAPITPVRLDYPIEAGDTLRIFGYGETETNGTSGRRMRENVRVLEVGPDSEDAPTITAAPRTFVVNEGPCHGDSGGPGISEDTGGLVGVYSLTVGVSCTAVGVRNVYTNLADYANVAREAFAAAGAEPVLDVPPAKPEAPNVVPESGCALSTAQRPTRSTSSVASAFLLALATLGVMRRRRA